MLISLAILSIPGFSQKNPDPGLLTIDRIFNSREFQNQYPPEIQWINGGDSYIVNEPSAKEPSWEDLVKYETSSQSRSVYVPAEMLIPEGANIPLSIESFTFSPG